MALEVHSSHEHGVKESLLNVVQERMQKAGKATIISRLVFVAKFAKRESTAEQLQAFFSKLIDKHYQEGEVTGMLLCFPTCFVNLLEGPTSALMSILRDTVSAGVNGHHAAEARVISSTEDIPSRCYSAYHAAFINSASTSESVDAADVTTIVKTASDVNAFMRKIGGALVGLGEGEIRRRMTSLDSYHEDIPAPEVVLSLVPAQDAPTLEEYLDIFDSPINVDLDSERVWPAPTPLK